MLGFLLTMAIVLTVIGLPIVAGLYLAERYFGFRERLLDHTAEIEQLRADKGNVQ